MSDWVIWNKRNCVYVCVCRSCWVRSWVTPSCSSMCVVVSLCIITPSRASSRPTPCWGTPARGSAPGASSLGPLLMPTSWCTYTHTHIHRSMIHHIFNSITIDYSEENGELSRSSVSWMCVCVHESPSPLITPSLIPFYLLRRNIWDDIRVDSAGIKYNSYIAPLCVQEASGAVGFQQLRERGVPCDVPEERRLSAVRLPVRLSPGGGCGCARVLGVFPIVCGVSVLIKHRTQHKETLKRRMCGIQSPWHTFILHGLLFL